MTSAGERKRAGCAETGPVGGGKAASWWTPGTFTPPIGEIRLSAVSGPDSLSPHRKVSRGIMGYLQRIKERSWQSGRRSAPFPHRVALASTPQPSSSMFSPWHLANWVWQRRRLSGEASSRHLPALWFSSTKRNEWRWTRRCVIVLNSDE